MSSLSEWFWYWLGYSQHDTKEVSVPNKPVVITVVKKEATYLTPEMLQETAAKLKPVDVSSSGIYTKKYYSR